ncbi:GH21062 [Drosophila grimshawi]|uniref:GH21062 n=2 Tax=Drosophila grimshawi TaxID=7222 RepID=B4J5J6_DROGR|nr:GH21062 [Drosophila grimshawi]
MQRIRLLLLLLIASVTLAAAQEQELPAQPGPQDGRIVGGWETKIEHFPHQVSLQLKGRHKCGGTILSSSIILTAAHCLPMFTNPNEYAIRAGSTLWSSGGSYVRVRQIIRHEQFNAPTLMNNDIAMVLLQQPLIFSPSIQPIEIVAPVDMVPAKAQLFVSGWGSTTVEQLTTAPRLHYTAIVQLDRVSCTKNYFGAGIVTHTMFCAGSKSGLGERDSCMGDSGGPLITHIDGRFKLLGIVSWGLGCANAHYPGVYTHVTAYSDWLLRTVPNLWPLN